VIFVAIVAAAAFSALTNSGALTPHHRLTGSLILSDTTGGGILAVAGGCFGSGGYSDIREGAGVTLKHGDGKLLGTGSLGAGTGGSSSCTFDYAIDNVPETAFYSLEISHRGALNFSLADMNASGWIAGATLGN